MDKAKDVASKVNSSSKQVKHKSAKNKGASSLKNVSSQNANNASGRIGVAAVALASTLSMLLPGATALAKIPLNADSFDSSYVKSAAKTSGKGAGKGNGKGDGNDLYKNGLLNTGATSERAMRQMVGSAKEYLVKHADSNADSNNSAAGVDNQEAAAGDSSVGVKDSGERSDAGSEASNDASSEAATDSATETATNGEQDNSDVAKPESKAVKKEQPAEAKPAETPASKAEPVKTEPAKTEVVNPTPAAKTADASKTEPANSAPAAKTDSSAKTEPDQKPAQPASTENAQSGSEQNASANLASTESADPLAKNEKEKAAPSTANADSENAKTAAEQPADEQSASTASTQPAAKSENDSNKSKVRSRRSVEESANGSNKGSSVTPEGADAGASSTDRSNENANGSNNNSNANSQVIKPNTDNPTAGDQQTANEQVQTDKKPKATYNLQIRYTIGGAANKQLVQPYELTIDQEDFDKLGKDDKYEYIELPKAAGYRPSVYHSGDYQYYIKNGEGNYVIDNGTDADATRYLRLSKKLITDYAVKQRQVVGGGNGAQAPQNPQNPSSAQTQSEDNGIQHYGELNINYAPKTAKYYVRHLVQDLNNKDEFHDAPNLGIGKVITVKHKDGTTENIHVTEITGTVGSDVTAVSTYIPGYEPEHNLISSPLSDSEDEKDKLVLNLRYYRKAYEVTYDSNGGTDVTAQKVYYQQTVPGVTEPTRRGYTFKGWSLVDPNTVNDPSSGLYSDPTVISDKDFKMPDHNVQFRAVWEENKTTNYRVNVWVQKADLVDKEHPKSLVNYDFVGLVERKNVKTGSSVDLKSMNDAGVANDPNKLSGTNKDNPILDSELGLTKEELQGKNSDHKDGLIAKFNWMNDTPVTSLDGYDTTNPGDAENKGKDLFTRYFHVNKKLTKRYTKDPNNTSTKLSANDLDNTFDLVYDRSEYELIFAKPAVLKSSEGAKRLNNAAIKRLDENGKTTIYCYAGGGNCSEKYDKNDEDGNTINHKGYRVNVRYGQSLTDIWPDVNELDFNEEGKGSLGWRIGYAGETEFRDTPPYRFTKKEFADPKFRVVGNEHKLKISDNPDSDPNNTYELKDNQRLLTADTSNTQVMPIQVIIEKQSIASAKSGNNPGDDDYVLSTDSYSKDDTSNTEYDHKSSSIAGFNSVKKEGRIEEYDSNDFDDDKLLPDLYSHSIEYENDDEKKDWDDLDDDAKEAFKKKYHVGFRKHLAGGGEDSKEYEENGYLVFKYNRKKYDVQFYNADGKAISAGTGSSDVAKEELPYEYSLSKRGKKDLTGEDKDLYGNDTSYDASVTKDGGTDTATQFDGKYTFKLNGKTYSIVRPDYLPKDYVFKGWAVDQAGIHLINGKINDNSEGTEGDGKAKGETKDFTMPVNGIKLYAAWGKPEGVKHTVTFDYNMPEIDKNGNEVADTNVVKEKQIDRYLPIDENKLGTPTRKGYDFYGWELAKKGNETLTNHTPYAFGNKVVEDITLKAVWIQDTRYNGTFKHIFLKPGYAIADYKNANESDKAAMIDHVSTQTVSGLREHLRYNAEAVYSDETHFPDKHFTSFEASSDEKQNTGEFIYQTYNTRKYKVKYIDQNGKDLLPESEVSSVNLDYDVAFYKPIAGFKPRELQHTITYVTDDDGKQKADDIRTFIFTYDDVRVLKRKDDTQVRPTNYTRYVFKVAAGQSTMGSIVGYDSKTAGEGGLVYDVIGGTKAYQMPLPQDPIPSNGYEFAGWTSKIYIDNVSGGQTESDGFKRLPILSESQSNPKVVYTANFKLKAPVAIDTKVLKPTDALTLDEASAKNLIKNSNEYPDGATFSFAQGEKFDNTPGLHKIKVQVKLDGNTAVTEVLYRVLPDLVYESDWEKFSQSDYGKSHVENNEYVKVTFTGDLQQGRILGHDGETSASKPSLFAYVYKGKKDISVRVPQAFGKEYEDDHYHYVFKGWTTGTETDPANITNYDIKSEDRYKKDTFSKDVTYTAVYKRIDYFSSSSDGGEVPKDAVVAIFKPAPGRLWKDGTSGPKVFYVKKSTDISKIPYSSSDPTNALVKLKENLTNATGTWKRSSMLNDGKKVTEVKDVAKTDDKWKDGWKVNESFQEFVADQKDWTEPDVKKDYFVAVQGDASTLPKLKDYVINLKALCDEAKIDANNVADVKVEYDLPKSEQEKFKQKMLDKPAMYTIPLKITVNYKDGISAETYKSVGLLKVIHKLMYPESLPKLANGDIDTNSPEAQQVLNNKNFAKVRFINADNDEYSKEGKGSFGENDRTLYYARKDSASGVKAPQVTGKDYDANGYHYVFKGWKKVNPPAANNAAHARTRRSLPDYSAIPLTTLFVNQPTSATSVDAPNTNNDLLTNEQIRNATYSEDTTYQAVYDRIPNVIDASKTKKTLEGYVPAVFLPEIGHRWKNGEYKPKLLYIRPSKESSDNIKFMKKVADSTGKELYGFSKWRMFTAQGDKLNIAADNSWNIAAPLIFVAEQTGVSDITIPETIVSAGDAIPDLDKLVNNTDPKNVKVNINHIYGQGVKPKDSSAQDDVNRVYSPGTATVVVDVTRPTDVEGQKLTTQIPIRVRVLPNVIADQDLPAKDTKEFKYIAQNYTKVTYIAGSGGEMKSPVFTYWVRKGANVHMPVPDVLADNGYVFKDWSTVRTDYSLDLSMNNAATAEQKEFLANRAELAGLSFVAKQIRASKHSSFAALKNLFDLGCNENGMTFNLDETTITANFEQMDPVEFKFSGKAVEGVPAMFTLANLTRGVLNADGTTNANATVSVDNKQFTVNALSSSSLSQLGISPSCSGMTCTISGTPKIVDGKKVVELTFTSVDKYGRKAKVTVDIEVLPASNDVNPTPTPEPDYSTVPSDYVVPAYEPAPAPVPVVPLQDKQKTGVKGDLLPQTGVDASQSALIASLLASVGFAGFAAKHRRKREDGKNN
ncbi:repeat protein [Gardnerella vaginalis]|uniref:InlB B-repeat-containing protein n=1 Tax=Gardnerella vaginalis TaxID=2702 RepID=UPI000E20FEBC|nr:InlB B-repeat-containing protein [Gardnerella vaginalis]RDW96529.1 repeat protein [Gardnerella vaginalis]RDW98741.1 repeat protein [Gardnerella vaginalis]